MEDCNNKDKLLDMYISKRDREIIRELGNTKICDMLCVDQATTNFCLEMLKSHGVELLYKNVVEVPDKWDYSYDTISGRYFDLGSLEVELYENYNIPYKGFPVFSNETSEGEDNRVSLSVVKYLREYNN